MKDYVEALFQQQWGRNLSKYDGIQMLGGVTLNGRQILEDASQFKKDLEDQVRSTYEIPPMDLVGDNMAFSNDPPNDYVFRDHTNLLKANGSAQEQTFIENLIVESIEIYGQDIYYLPRTYVNRDTILGEVENSNFTQALAVRAYVNNVEGWEGQGELLSKFGVRIEDKTTFVFSREKFTSAVDDNAVLNVEGRPNEGDLIWFPAAKHLFEIQFVEAERPFYQLGKGYVWEVNANSSNTADEDLDTGVAEIDAIETAFANAIKLVMDAGGTGDFTVGEDCWRWFRTSNATAS